ncbi:MAG: peptide deformylase [Gammaproteobacteria bacterium]
MVPTFARMGNPILYQRAQEVVDQTDPGVQKLLADLIEAFYISNGTGLAAPQLFQPFRIVVFHASAERTAKHGYEKEIPFTVLINPIIEPVSDEIAMTWEACLSLPGMMGEVPRYKHIRYQGLTPEGKCLIREVDGFHSYVVQHECDHLDGILYPMRMQNLSRLGFVDEFRNILAAEFLEEFR